MLQHLQHNLHYNIKESSVSTKKYNKWSLEKLKNELTKQKLSLLNEDQFKHIVSKINIIDEYGYKFFLSAENIINKKNHRKFHKSNPHAYENICLFLHLNNSRLKIIDREIEFKVNFQDDDGYKYLLPLNMCLNPNSRKFHKSNPHTTENIKLWVNKNESKFSGGRVPILANNQKYIDSTQKMKFVCSNCDSTFDIKLNSLLYFGSCPFCSPFYKRVKPNLNSLNVMRPDLIKYFVDANVTQEITPRNNKVFMMKCPNCNYEKNMSCDNLFKFGFSCPNCSDGVSIPNKFLVNIFRQLNHEFKPEKTFDASTYRYDLYVETENQNYTIEAHGLQHYKENTNYHLSLSEQQENDMNKRLFSESLGNIHIEVDCRFSDFDYLKEQFIKSLSPYFDLSNIDWDDLLIETFESSLLIKICEYYNIHKLNPKNISNFFKLSANTITKYLKIGNKLKLCIYDNSTFKYNRTNKKIDQYSTDGILIETHDSIKSAANKLNIHNTSISHALKKQKLSCGYMWKYHNVI